MSLPVDVEGFLVICFCCLLISHHCLGDLQKVGYTLSKWLQLPYLAIPGNEECTHGKAKNHQLLRTQRWVVHCPKVPR